MEYLWSATLNNSNKSVDLWKEDKGHEEVHGNCIILQHALLSTKAKNKLNLVNLSYQNLDEDEVTIPLVILGGESGVQQLSMEITLNFAQKPCLKLSEGSGPIHLIGQLMAERDDVTKLDHDDEEEEEEEEEEEDLEAELDELKDEDKTNGVKENGDEVKTSKKRNRNGDKMEEEKQETRKEPSKKRKK